MTGEELYDAMGADYERMVAWEQRLANETPFFRQLFADRGVRRVVDVACGVGRHAIEFASWGLDVVGADPSPELLGIARASATEAGVQVEFVQTDFLNLADSVDGGFDAAICIGNSLPHLLAREDVLRALEQMSLLLVEGGVLVIQTRSAERIWAQGNHLLKPRLVPLDGRDVIFLRLVDVHPPTTTLNVIRLDRQGATWDVDAKATELRPIPQQEMAESLQDAGLLADAWYGDYQAAPFVPGRSEDLLVVATKTGAPRGAR